MKNVLIAITTFNQAQYTEKCFESLKHSKAKIICIDDASTDHTKKVCERYNVEFIGRDQPMGLTYSWNLAYRYFLEHDYDYLVISNNDVLIPEGCIEQLVENLKTNPYVGVMTRRNEESPWADVFGVETYYDIESEIVDHSANYKIVQDKIMEAPLDPLPVDIIYGFCFGISRDIQKYEYSHKTLFNPQNINVAQEIDLARRVPSKLLCRRAFVYHYKTKSFGISSFKKKKGQDPREQLELFHHPFFILYFEFKKIFIQMKHMIHKYALRKTSFRRPTVVMIVGMHRSGTSALAGLLHHSGISMGCEENFIPKALPQNPKGFYENHEFRLLNDALLKKNHYHVKSWAVNTPSKIKTSFLLQMRMKRLLKKELKKNINWGWKDPRNCLTLKAWLDVLKAMCLRNYTKILYIYRHPISVAKSLATRGDTDYESALRLWKNYNLTVMKALRHKKCDAFYLSYEELIQHPEKATEKIFSYLCAKPYKHKVSEFLDTNLNRSNFDQSQNENLAEDIKEIYDELERRRQNAPFKCFF